MYLKKIILVVVPRIALFMRFFFKLRIALFMRRREYVRLEELIGESITHLILTLNVVHIV